MGVDQSGALVAALANGDSADINLGSDLGGLAAENNNLRLFLAGIMSAIKVCSKIQSCRNDVKDQIVKLVGKLSKRDINIKIDSKIQNQMIKRGWDNNSIRDTISNPSRIVKTKDTRYNADQTRNDDPATVYINKDKSYVVRNDRTGDIVQISNRNKQNWKTPWD